MVCLFSFNVSQGANAPTSLPELEIVYEELWQELNLHMHKEEMMFPAIARFDATTQGERVSLDHRSAAFEILSLSWSGSAIAPATHSADFENSPVVARCRPMHAPPTAPWWKGREHWSRPAQPHPSRKQHPVSALPSLLRRRSWAVTEIIKTLVEQPAAAAQSSFSSSWLSQCAGVRWARHHICHGIFNHCAS